LIPGHLDTWTPGHQGFLRLLNLETSKPIYLENLKLQFLGWSPSPKWAIGDLNKHLSIYISIPRNLKTSISQNLESSNPENSKPET
jgi:hypothetical protein